MQKNKMANTNHNWSLKAKHDEEVVTVCVSVLDDFIHANANDFVVCEADGNQFQCKKKDLTDFEIETWK